MSNPIYLSLPKQWGNTSTPTGDSIVPTAKMSLWGFVWKEKVNRKYLVIAIIATLIEFAIFKSQYPFPDFFSDSYSYLYAAYAHLDLNIWPIGYSKFLYYFHCITHSDVGLIATQYFLLVLGALYFFYTWLFFVNPGKNSRNIMYIFLFFNPLFLYISNYVNSDPLFASVSLFWFTELIWVIYRPKWYRIFTQGLLLFLCFTIRNNAYYYPFVAIIAFLISNRGYWYKLVGCLMAPILILPFILHTQAVAKQMTGTSQYSLFTGWQLANNALYMYEHIEVDSNKLSTKGLKEINNLSGKFYSGYRNRNFDAFLYDNEGNFFIQYPRSPLKQYLLTHYGSNDEYNTILNWGKVSVLYKEYGEWLILNHPISFFRYFILLNLKNYFAPHLEKLRIYNLGAEDIDPIAQNWFQYNSYTITSIAPTLQGKLLSPFPFLFMFLNFYCIGGIVWLLYAKSFPAIPKSEKKIFLLAISIISLNALFCIFTTIIVMRYEFFPMIPLLLLATLISNKITSSKQLAKLPAKTTQDL